MTSGIHRRATSKPPPPHPKPKPKALASHERRVWQAMGRITRRPRAEWHEAARIEIQNFRGIVRDYFEQALEIVEMNEDAFPAAFIQIGSEIVHRDPDHVDQGGGTPDREVIQGIVQDRDLTTAPVVMGQPLARFTPTSTMTTVDWERITNAGSQEPRTPSPREIVEF